MVKATGSGGPNNDNDCIFGMIYVVISYLLYWPIFYLWRAGAEYNNIVGSWGPPEVWVVWWILAPIMTPMYTFFAFLSWIGFPLIKWLAQVLV